MSNGHILLLILIALPIVAVGLWALGSWLSSESMSR